MKKSNFTKLITTAFSIIALANFSGFAVEPDSGAEDSAKTTKIQLKDRSDSEKVENSSTNSSIDNEANNKTEEKDEYDSDSYDDSEKLANSTDEYSEDADDSAKKESKSASTSKKEKKGKGENPFEKLFSTRQTDYHFYETIPLSTGTLGYGIKARDAEIFLIPGTSKVGIQTYFQSSWFDIIIEQKDVSLIAEGLEKYLQDFEQHKLIKNKTAKTRRMYTDKGKCRVEWGTIKTMMNNYGDTKFHVGYEFKKNTPYFCIIVKDAKNIAQDIGTNVSQGTVEMQLYFSKAQAKRLVEVMGIERYKQEIEKLTSNEIFSTDEY